MSCRNCGANAFVNADGICQDCYMGQNYPTGPIIDSKPLVVTVELVCILGMGQSPVVGVANELAVILDVPETITGIYFNAGDAR